MKEKLEKELFRYFHERHSEEDLEELKKEHDLNNSELVELIEGHYYLAPSNIQRAQLLLGVLVIIMSLTVMMIRLNNDWVLISLTALMGTVVALPFFLLYMLLRSSNNLQKIRLWTRISFAYSIFCTSLFIFLAVSMDLFGAALIPVVIVVFYIIEMGKLNRLISNIKNIDGVSKSN